MKLYIVSSIRIASWGLVCIVSGGHEAILIDDAMYSFIRQYGEYLKCASGPLYNSSLDKTVNMSVYRRANIGGQIFKRCLPLPRISPKLSNRQI